MTEVQHPFPARKKTEQSGRLFAQPPSLSHCRGVSLCVTPWPLPFTPHAQGALLVFVGELDAACTALRHLYRNLVE